MITTYYLPSLFKDDFIAYSRLEMPPELPDELEILNKNSMPERNKLYIAKSEDITVLCSKPFKDCVAVLSGCTAAFIKEHESDLDLINAALVSCGISETLNILLKEYETRRVIENRISECFFYSEPMQRLTVRISEIIDGDSLLIINKRNILAACIQRAHGLLEEDMNLGRSFEESAIYTEIQKNTEKKVLRIICNKSHTTLYCIKHTITKPDDIILILEINKNCKIDLGSLMQYIARDIFSKISFQSSPGAQSAAVFQECWNQIIAPGSISKSELERMLGNLPNPVSIYPTIAVINLESNPKTPFSYVTAVLRNAFPHANIAVDRTNVVIIFSETDIAPGKRNPEFEQNTQLNLILNTYNGYMMYGNYTINKVRLRDSYVLTSKTLAMAMGLEKESNKRIFYFEDYFLNFYMELASKAYLSLNPDMYRVSLVHPAATILRRHDMRENDDLSEVLFYFLLNERNITRASQALHLHRNTVANKLEKIKTLIDVDLDDNNLRQRLIFSFQIIEFYKNTHSYNGK